MGVCVGSHPLQEEAALTLSEQDPKLESHYGFFAFTFQSEFLKPIFKVLDCFLYISQPTVFLPDNHSAEKQFPYANSVCTFSPEANTSSSTNF